ncbi:MAG: AIM24 family protein [Theionarchaea archaeon]|nr:AIM24 family protein [Theionarchaea archaeon]MBU7000587.1 AIM24 family protein [Theionarchaea archaeon]MBU7020489.1 AIM24 family protein [Theionarchaea archaeon]MBU7034469.1 AIM24 family protein [Theionarchaea archaeon]MBU7039782.1 AIM24 family protein [Theionarchaea archaeon]
MQHEISGELFQWLRITISSESVWGSRRHLLCKSEEVQSRGENLFFGTGWIVFAGNGKIREFYLHAADSLVFREASLLASDVTANQTSLSSPYMSLVKVSGPGVVFAHGKDFAEFYLEESEFVEARTDCIAAMDDSVTFELGAKTSVLSGPGAVLMECAFSEKEESAPYAFFDQV